MTIGLITYHRALNYGAVLQCYALQQELKRMGHEVRVIDYRQPHVEAAYRPVRLSWMLKKVAVPWRLPAYLRYIRQMRRKQELFGRFRRGYLTMSAKCGRRSVPTDYDAYVIGSDQMWARHITGGFDPVYFGDFRRKAGSLLLGYAVSGTLESMRALGPDAAACIGRFDAFSFREKALADAVGMPAGSQVEITIDPTLLADPSVWEPLSADAPEEGRYVVLYEVRRPEDDPDRLRRHADALASRLGCRVIDLSPNDEDVSRFVSLLRHATCVVTSSFHATAFSLIFSRPFYTYMLHDGHDSRYVDLLTAVGLQEALVEPDFEPRSLPAYDFNAARRRLDGLRGSSRRFLTDALAKGPSHTL